MKTVYIIGRFFAQTASTEHEVKTAWEIMGVFEDEDEAKRNCLTENDFVGPLELNKPLIEDCTNKPWPGCYYPIKGD